VLLIFVIFAGGFRIKRAISASPGERSRTWQALTQQMPINPIHTALMHNGKSLSSRVPELSGANHLLRGRMGSHYEYDHHADAELGSVLQQAWWYSRTAAIIVGGNLQYDPFFGWNRTTVYDPATGNYVDMEDMAHGRWYPTDTFWVTAG